MATPVVGTVFELAKACAAHRTAAGMFAVVMRYEKNSAKGDRLEAGLTVWKDESLAVKVGAAERALHVDSSALRADEKQAHQDVVARADIACCVGSLTDHWQLSIRVGDRCSMRQLHHLRRRSLTQQCWGIRAFLYPFWG